ncbi:MAG: O-antigen ligase family protein [Chloroflexota bacterium]
MKKEVLRTNAFDYYRLRLFYVAQRSGILLDISLLVVGLLIVLIGAYLIGQGENGFYVLGGVIALALAVVVTVKPTVGLYFLVVFVYLNLSDILEISFHIPSINKPIIGLVFAAVLANRIVLHGKPLNFHKVVSAILVYGIALLFSAFIAGDQTIALNYMGDWIKDFAVLLIILQFCDDETAWKKIHWLLILCATFVGLLSCIQILSGNFSNQFFGLANTSINQITNSFDSTRVSGPLSDPNYYAQMILMILPLAAYQALAAGRPRTRALAAVCAAIIFMTVIFTYSRAASVAMVILLFLIVRERKLNLYKIGFGLAVSALIVFPLLPAGYLDRILTLQSLLGGPTTSQSDLSFRGRLSEMLVAVNMFLDHPVLGIGIANYEDNYLTYSDQLGIDHRLENREAHSLYLEILAETGLVGEVTFLIVIMSVFLALRRAKRQLKTLDRPDLVIWVSAVQYSVLSFLLTSIFLHGAYSRYMWLIISVSIGAAVMVQQLATKTQSTNQNEGVALFPEIQQ